VGEARGAGCRATRRLTHVPAKWIPVRRQEHASSVDLQPFPAWLSEHPIQFGREWL
jgi:hypothetical protein